MRCWGDWCDVGAIGAMLGPLERYWSDVRAIGAILKRYWGDINAMGRSSAFISMLNVRIWKINVTRIVYV